MNYLIKFKNWIIFTVLGVGVVLAAGQVIPDKMPEHLKLKVDKMNIVESREVSDIRIDKIGGVVNHGRIIKYDYVSDKKVNKNVLFKKDDKFSNSILIQDGDNKIAKTFVGGSHFYKDTNGIWEIEHGATTTIKAWKKQTLSLSDRLFGMPAFAISSTTYVGAGDGRNHNRGTGNTWDATHNETTSSYVSYTIDILNCSCGKTGAGLFYIERAAFPADMSLFDDNIVVSSASLYIYAETIADDDNDGYDYVVLVETDQPDPTVLTTADYNNYGAIDNPTEKSARKDLSSLSAGWHCFALTDTSLIDPTGYAMVGMREGHDVEDHPYAGGSGSNNYFQARMSEYAGSGSDPYYIIEYTIPAAEEAPIQRPNIIWFD